MVILDAIPHQRVRRLKEYMIDDVRIVHNDYDCPLKIWVGFRRRRTTPMAITPSGDTAIHLFYKGKAHRTDLWEAHWVRAIKR